MKEKTKNFLKQNCFKTSIIIIAIVMVGSAFYWYELRPSKIKHDCSWVKKYSGAISEITQEQYDECMDKQTNDRKKDFEDCKGKSGLFCDLFLDSICPKPRNAQPAKDWWEKANKNEYDFCIHEKGL